jgi:hypothetical protein
MPGLHGYVILIYIIRGLVLISTAITHETRKQANIPDTSVYGVATDSSEWVFIRIRPNGEVRNLR